MGFVNVAAVEELPPGACLHREIEGTAVALFNVDGAYHALAGRCPHRGGPLGDGVLSGREVLCPWHAWSFDVTSGQNVNNPDIAQPRFAVQVEDGRILVDLPS